MKNIILIFYYMLGIATLTAQEWVKINPTFQPPIDAVSITAVTFVDKFTGWAFESSAGRIWKTRDGAQNWTLQFKTYDELLSEGSATDSVNCWVGSTKGIWHTSDGGLNWKLTELKNKIYSVKFLDLKHGFVGGAGGIWETTDSGKTWVKKEIFVPDTVFVYDLQFSNNSAVYAIGIVGYSSFYMLHSSDSGQTWNSNYIASHYNPTSYHVFSNKEILVGGINGCLFLDSNFVVTGYNDLDFVNDMYFKNDDYGWLIGNNGLCVFTQDKAKTWVDHNVTNKELLDIEFVNNGNNGFIFGTSEIFTIELTTYVRELNKTNELNILSNNFPNPFNPSTTINYSIPATSNINLIIYDMMGKRIKSFEKNGLSAGVHSELWDGRNENGELVSSGIYIYKFEAISQDGNAKVFEESNKLMLLK